MYKQNTHSEYESHTGVASNEPMVFPDRELIPSTTNHMKAQAAKVQTEFALGANTVLFS